MSVVIFAIEELECMVWDSVQLFCLILFVVAWKFWVVLGRAICLSELLRSLLAAFNNFSALYGTLWNMLTLPNTFLMGGALTQESFQDALGRFWHVFSLIDWIMWGMEYIQQKRDRTS